MENQEKVLRNEYMQLQSKMQSADIYSSKEYPRLAKRLSELAKILDLFDRKKAIEIQISEARHLKNSDNEELSKLADQEIEEIKPKIKQLDDELSELLLDKDPNDERDCIIEIRAAAGGDESSLFAGDLYRMYIRWAEVHGYKTELLNQSPNEVGGFKEIIFMIHGEGAYGNLKFEAGVHRVQRIPTTESSGRIHTSTVTVAVLPEAEENDIEVKSEDLRIDVFRSSGHGGQSVNTTDSAVRITHSPTGIVVSMQDEKSQTKNKEKALGVLRSRLLQMKLLQDQAQLTEALIGSGDRAEKIRTYNFPQDRVTDHRIGYSRSNLPGALNGEIDDLIENLHSYELQLIANDH
jgi:peptide chain release factor 1